MTDQIDVKWVDTHYEQKKNDSVQSKQTKKQKQKAYKGENTLKNYQNIKNRKMKQTTRYPFWN